jgi:hypothetical protein
MVNREYNQVNRFYLDKRRPEFYRVRNPETIAGFGDAIPNSRSKLDPDMRVVLGDPLFKVVLHNGVFYKQDFGQVFQLEDHTVRFGYLPDKSGEDTTRQFAILRFPRGLAESLHFHSVENGQ